MPISKSLSKNQELLDLMKSANEHHEGVLAAHSRSIDETIKCGKALQAAKDIVDHGKWGKFVCDNFNGSERTAQRYMQVYRAVASGDLKNNYETLFELEAAISKTPSEPRPSEKQSGVEDEQTEETTSEPSEKTNKKEGDPLTAAFKAIGRAINSVEDDKKEEWAKLLHAEINLYMGPFERSRKIDAINETADALDRKQYGDEKPLKETPAECDERQRIELEQFSKDAVKRKGSDAVKKKARDEKAKEKADAKKEGKS